MATRGTISIENVDGTIDSVYSHWDNYIDYNGKLLFENYNTREKVEKLISGGGISSLGSYVSDSPRQFQRDSCIDNYTVYYQYRGEEAKNTHWPCFEEFENNQIFEEFNYIFTKDDVWSVIYDEDWCDLEDELLKLKVID